MRSRAALAACATLTACGRLHFDALGDGGDGATSHDASDAAPAFVQATVTTNVDGPSTAVMFPSPIAANDTILAFAWSWGPNAASVPAGSVSDSAGSQFAVAGAVQSMPGTCGGMAAGGAVFFAHASTAIANDTVTFASNNTENGMVAIEYTSLLVPDLTTSKIDAAMGPPQQTFSTDALVTTAAPELLVSLGIPCSGGGGTITWVSNGGFNIRGFSTDTADQPAMVSDLLALTPGSYSATWTITFAANPSIAAALLVTFR